MLFQQKIDEQPYPCRHGRAADEDHVDRFPITRVERLQQRDQRAALQVIEHGEFADAHDAGAHPGQLRQGLTAAAFDVAADLQGEQLSVANEWPVGFRAPEVEAQAVVLQQVLRLLWRCR